MPSETSFEFYIEESTKGPMIIRDTDVLNRLDETDFLTITDELSFNGITYLEFIERYDMLTTMDIIYLGEDIVTFNSIEYSYDTSFDQLLFDNSTEWLEAQIEERLQH